MIMKDVHGGDVYSHPGVLDFSANLNPFGTPIGVVKGLQEKCYGLWAYPDVACRALKEAIAQKHHISKTHIICSNGAADLFYTLVQARRPQKVLLVEPSFSEYRKACEVIGTEIVTYLLRKEEQFDLGEGYYQVLEEDIEMAFLCTPNNPTGKCIEGQLLKNIIQICKEKKIFLVIDESFLEFTSQNAEESMISLMDENPHLFIVRSFTKLYAIAGVRLGYGVCSDEVFLEKMEKIRQPWSISSIAQEAGVLCLKEEAYAKACVSQLIEERHFLEKALNRLGIAYIQSEANFILFQGPENLKEDLLKQGILIRDCSYYGGLRKGYFRIAVRTREENQELIHCLEKIIQSST